MDEILSVKDAAEELGVAVTTVRYYCQKGRMGRKLGREWIVFRYEVENFKKLRRKSGRPVKGESVPNFSAEPEPDPDFKVVINEVSQKILNKHKEQT